MLSDGVTQLFESQCDAEMVCQFDKKVLKHECDAFLGKYKGKICDAIMKKPGAVFTTFNFLRNKCSQ